MLDWSRIRDSLSDDTRAARGRWAAWRQMRAERDVLASYRADYGEEARFRWWQRFRGGAGLLFVIVLMGTGLATLVGGFFIGLTILLETLV